MLGSSVGLVFGGGGGVVLPQNIFIDARASRFKKDGQRVVVDRRTTSSISASPTPSRLRRSRSPADIGSVGTATACRPYAGGGISWYQLRGNRPVRDVQRRGRAKRFTGFHLLGGAEFRVHNGLGSQVKRHGRVCRMRSASNRAASARRSTKPISAARRSAPSWSSAADVAAPSRSPDVCSRRSGESRPDASRPTGTSPALAGSPRAHRAVGSILRECRDPATPCHRVIGAGGGLGGYGSNLHLKRELLRAEGHEVGLRRIRAAFRRGPLAARARCRACTTSAAIRAKPTPPLRLEPRGFRNRATPGFRLPV